MNTASEELLDIARQQIRTTGEVSEGVSRMMMARIEQLERRLAYKDRLIDRQRGDENRLEARINELEENQS